MTEKEGAPNTTTLKDSAIGADNVFAPVWDGSAWSIEQFDKADGARQSIHTEHGDTGRVECVDFDGTFLYSGDVDGNLIKSDLDGDIQWSQNYNNSEIESCKHDSDTNSVFIVDNQNLVRRVDASDGSSEWTHSHHSDVARDCVPDEDHVYSVSYDNTVVKAEKSDGSLVWQEENHNDDAETIVKDESRVYSGGDDARVVASEKQDGSVAWDKGFSTTMIEGLALVESFNFFFAAGDGTLFCFDRDSRETLSAFNDNTAGSGATDTIRTCEADNEIVIIGDNDNVIALETESFE